MSPKEKKQLAEILASLNRNDRMKLSKRASQLRKNSLVKKSFRTSESDAEEDEITFQSQKSKSLDEFLWQIVRAEQQSEQPTADSEQCLVTSVFKAGCEVMKDGKPVTCSLPSSKPLNIAVGDQAFVNVVEGQFYVTGIAPRKSALSRPDVHNSNKERVIAANLDIVVVVVSVVSPPLHPRIIDRYLLAIQHGGCEPVLAVNKLDLAEGVQRQMELSKLDPYRAINVPIFECIARDGVGITQLRSYLTGKVAAFVGHSGVGKSSLINAFDERLNQAVGDISEGYGRGTHTTTRSCLIDLGDLKVIDTPGIRSFGLWDIKSEDLKDYFAEFDAVGSCRFNDCTHINEPHCSVKKAVDQGIISEARYDTYLRILESLK